jgi:hypothetical protein
MGGTPHKYCALRVEHKDKGSQAETVSIEKQYHKNTALKLQTRKTTLPPALTCTLNSLNKHVGKNRRGLTGVKKILPVFLIISMTGCVNVPLFGGAKTHHEDCRYSRAFPESYWANSQVTPNPSRSSIVALLGKPARIEKSEAGERWHYSNGYKWRGAIPMLGIIPIPLIAPVGKDYSILNFEGDQCKSIDEQLNYSGMVMCGLYWPELTAMTINDTRGSRKNPEKLSHFFGYVSHAHPRGMGNDVQIQFMCGFESAWKEND